MLEGILHLCRKHDSYMCRTLLRSLQNFVGNIPTLLNFVRKIPTHGTKCKTYYCGVGIIPKSKCRNCSYKCKNNSYTISHV